MVNHEGAVEKDGLVCSVCNEPICGCDDFMEFLKEEVRHGFSPVLDYVHKRCIKFNPPVGLGSLGEEIQEMVSAAKDPFPDLEYKSVSQLQAIEGSLRRMLLKYWKGDYHFVTERMIEESITPETRIGYRPC